MLDAPTAQVFMLLDLQLEEMKEQYRKEQEKFFLDYLAQIFAAPPQPGESEEFSRARENFTKQITPDHYKQQPKRFVWSNIPPEVLAEYENNQPLIEERREGE